MGVITVQSFKKHAYTEYHLNLLQNLASYTSIALDNAGAYRQLNEQEREIRQRAAELATIDNISRALASELELGTLIPQGRAGAEGLWRPDRISGAARQGHQHHPLPLRLRRRVPRVPFGAAHLTHHPDHEPLLINEDISRTAQLNITRRGRGGCRTWCADPVGNEVTACSACRAPRRGAFTDADLRLLTTIAANVGVAIHNARLFEETRQARAAAEEADAAKSAFLSTVSHELRTP
jgi:GAF domain-containing protein